MKKINFMCTAFRDGFQSVYGARVFSKDYLPAVEAAAAAGIQHFEAGGGAMFQSPIFYANENAFDIMNAFRKAAGPNANLQTLARGVNVVCLDSQNSEIIKLHADLFKKHGMTTVRNFDALNDVNNLIYSGQCIHNAGLKHEVTVTMMALPPGCSGAHDPDFYEKTLKAILDAGIPYDSIAFKDASGTSIPHVVHETIKRARKLLGDKAKIVFHSHDTSDICIAQYLAAIEGGADQVDLSMDPVSGGTCQSDILSMWHALRGTEYTLDIDPDKIIKAEQVLADCMKEYFLPPEAKQVTPIIPFSPLPGGALTANTQMLRDNGLMDRFSEVTLAMGDAVKKGGFGTSVTPVSQFYFQQAFNNVMFGPWKKIADGYGKMVLGYFGKTPVPPDPEAVKAAAEQLGLPPTDKKTLEINDAKEELKRAHIEALLQKENIAVNDENVFIAAACGDKGIMFLKGKGVIGVRKNAGAKTAGGASAADGVTVTVNGKSYGVKIEGGKAIVNGKSYAISVKEGLPSGSPAPAASAPAASSGSQEVNAPLPGLVLRVSVKEGDQVNAGDTILVLEAMKMETPIKAKASGVVSSLAVNQGDQVKSGQLLAVLG